MTHEKNSTTSISTCRVCGHATLSPILSLGNHAISGFVTNIRSMPTYPLALTLCTHCGLIQLAHHSLPADTLYRKYWYKSGVNQSMNTALSDVAKSAVQRLRLKPGDIILDIGANDGTLLGKFRQRGIIRVAVEPARNLIPELSKHADIVINDFYTHKTFTKRTHGKKASIITTIAMFYDLEDPNSFISDLSTDLTQNGVWINQMASLTDMLKYTMFDNVCHEHLEYYSLSSLEYLYAKHNLTIFDIETNDTNGGSFRVYATHTKDNQTYMTHQSDARLRQYRALEKKMKLTDRKTYVQFSKQVKLYRKTIQTYIAQAIRHGKSVWGYGASTKGNTLLQYYALDHTSITAIAERNAAKWGMFTAGTHIPIASEKEMRNKQPDILLVLPWHFRKEFIKREKAYLQNGGALLFPLPHPEVITWNTGKLRSTPLI